MWLTNQIKPRKQYSATSWCWSTNKQVDTSSGIWFKNVQYKKWHFWFEFIVHHFQDDALCDLIYLSSPQIDDHLYCQFCLFSNCNKQLVSDSEEEEEEEEAALALVAGRFPQSSIVCINYIDLSAKTCCLVSKLKCLSAKVKAVSYRHILNSTTFTLKTNFLCFHYL